MNRNCDENGMAIQFPTDEGDPLFCQVDQCFVAAVDQMAEKFLKQSSKANHITCVFVCVFMCAKESFKQSPRSEYLNVCKSVYVFSSWG